MWDGEPPNIFLIRAHFEEYKLDRWDRNRTARLCKTIGCTIEELFGLAGIFNGQRIRKLHNAETLPPEVALHFVRLERFVYAQIFETAFPPDPQDIQSARILSRIKDTHGRPTSIDGARQHDGAAEADLHRGATD